MRSRLPSLPSVVVPLVVMPLALLLLLLLLLPSPSPMPSKRLRKSSVNMEKPPPLLPPAHTASAPAKTSPRAMG